ncbi:hypothetical protein LTR66_011972 [Elasticomyces elasticus]|nr:hypothetical protein LTR66_011972 [Elasticomyces elasticus]
MSLNNRVVLAHMEVSGGNTPPKSISEGKPSSRKRGRPPTSGPSSQPKKIPKKRASTSAILLDAQPPLVLALDKDGQDRVVSSVTQEADDAVKNRPSNHGRAASETSPLRDTIVVAQPQPRSVRPSTTESVYRVGVSTPTSEKKASDPSSGPKKQPHIAQSLSNASARVQEPGQAQRPTTTTAPAQGSKPNHCDDAKTSSTVLGGSCNRDGGFGTASPTNGDAAQGTTVAGANTEDGSSTPQGSTLSSVPVQNAIPTVPGPIAEHVNHLVDSTRTSRGDETRAGNQPQLGDADDEEALRVGHVFMKYKRGGKILEQKRQTMDEQSAQIQVSERHIAREQATLEDMHRQARLLQEQMRTTEDNIERDCVRLSQIGKTAEKARSEVESLSRELEDIKKELFS